MRIHPASVNSRLKIEKPEGEEGGEDEEAPPEFAALLFFDEITRGDASLCTFVGSFIQSIQ